MPRPAFKSVSDIKSVLLQPALTSHFLVEINTSPLGNDFTKFLGENKVAYSQENLNLMCNEASLPGSNLATLEVTSDFTGVTERHAYRRVYDDRIDLTFYVDAENYMPIRFFETWIKFIADESISEQRQTKGVGSIDPNYFYRFRYPEQYNRAGITITKFERTSDKKTNEYVNSSGFYSRRPLVYKFVNCFPISIASMPVSYETSSLLKCTVSMTYIRYLLTADENIPSSSSSTPPNEFQIPTTPGQQAIFNQVSNNLTGAGALATSVPGLNIGGVPTLSANSSGNTVSRSTTRQSVSEIKNLQEASRLRQAGFSPGLGQGGRQGPGF